MKLITKELEKIFEKYPLGSQDGLGGHARVIAKFFNPTGVGTWLITEAEKLDNGDYEMFGYCHLGDDEMAELGYVLLSQLEEIKLPFGLTIERDMYLPKDCDLIQAMQITGIEPPSYMLKNYEKDNVEKIIVGKFANEILKEYELELQISDEGNSFKLHDLQGANLGNIEQEEFKTIADVIGRLDIYHEDYIYRSLEERKYDGEIIPKSDWDLTVKRYIESDEISKILSQITPTEYQKIVEKNEENILNNIIKILDKNQYPLIEKYVASDKILSDFFYDYSFEQLDDFEKTLHLYFETDNIILNDANELESKNGEVFNRDIIQLAEGLISYEDFAKSVVKNDNEIEYNFD